MRQLGVLMTATQKRLLLALTAVTAPATATPTASRERFQGLSFLPGFNGEEAMKLRICRLFAILVFCCFAGAQALAQTAYITNSGDNTVSVIDTTSNTVTATIPGFSEPIAFGVFIGPPPVLATPPSGTACNGCSTAPSRAR